jgi:mRNA-degrading endonuclease RelE of RelBE toxin-antitoxin system
MRTIERSSAFRKDIQKVPREIQAEVFSTVQKLLIDPFDETMQVRKLADFKKVFRVKIKKDYRLVYTFDEKFLYLIRFAHRKDIYKLEYNLDF